MVALPTQHNMVDFPEPVQVQGKTSEWYTPSTIIEAARFVMNGIELDPASCEQANRVVRAERYYTKRDNGLTQSWLARSIWLNPPFSLNGAHRGMEPGRVQGSIIKLWLSRLVTEYRQGNVTEAILLTKSDMKAYWFNMLWDFPICFARDHLYFNRPGLPPEKHFFGTCFVYLGPNEQKFIETFSAFGRIARAIDTPKPSPVNLSLWNGGDA